MKIDWDITQWYVYDFHRFRNDGCDTIMMNQACYDSVLEYYKNQPDLYNYKATYEMYEKEKGKLFFIVQDNSEVPHLWTAHKEIICYDEEPLKENVKQTSIFNPDDYDYGIHMTNDTLCVKLDNGDLFTVSGDGVFIIGKEKVIHPIVFDNPGVVPMAHCSLCDGHHGCDNCYYGQIDSKQLEEHCGDCEHNGDKAPTQWTTLGDTYCRKCGRKLPKP